MHDHSTHSHGSKKAGNNHQLRLWWVLLLSLSYMVAEIVGGIWSGSLALMADAGHMAIDTMAIALGLFAVWIARKPATLEKTYGYHRAEILAALLNGATLLMVSVGIFYEAFQRFSSPSPILGGVMIVVAAGGLFVNLLSVFLLHRGREDNLNMQGVWLHLLTDTLGSVAALSAAF